MRKLLNEEFNWRRDKLDKVEPVSGPAEEIKCSEVRGKRLPSQNLTKLLVPLA